MLTYLKNHLSHSLKKKFNFVKINPLTHAAQKLGSVLHGNSFLTDDVPKQDSQQQSLLAKISDKSHRVDNVKKKTPKK